VLPIVVCVLLFLVAYAPWTLFWALRVLCVAVCIGYVAYFVDDAREGRWSSGWPGSHSAWNAFRGFIGFGVPALLVMVMRRPSVCPYDERGRTRPIEALRVVRLARPRHVERAVWEPLLRERLARSERKRVREALFR
jgi:hypothetical protein